MPTHDKNTKRAPRWIRYILGTVATLGGGIWKWLERADVVGGSYSLLSQVGPWLARNWDTFAIVLGLAVIIYEFGRSRGWPWFSRHRGSDEALSVLTSEAPQNGKMSERITALEAPVSPSGVHQLWLVFRHVTVIHHASKYLVEISEQAAAIEGLAVIHMSDLIKRDVVKPLSEFAENWQNSMFAIQGKSRLSATERDKILTSAGAVFRACGIALDSVIKIEQILGGTNQAPDSEGYIALRSALKDCREELERASKHPEVSGIAAYKHCICRLEEYESLLTAGR